MDFTMLPPEVNSGRMYAGPGSGPMLAAAAAWDGLAAELQSTTASYGSAISELSGGPWLGPSSATMAAAAAPYMEWMTTTAAQAEQTATQAKAAAAAYEAAFAMTVPPPLIAANRSLLMTLIATNVLGQNTAAIAATETDYAEMWAQDAAAMYGYAGSAAAASTLTPFTSPPPTTNPAGAGSQATAVAQSSMMSGSRVINAVPQALQGLASSAAADPPSAGALSDLLSAISLCPDGRGDPNRHDFCRLHVDEASRQRSRGSGPTSAALRSMPTVTSLRAGGPTRAMGRAPPSCRNGSGAARAASVHRRTRRRHPYPPAWARQTRSADCRCRRLGRWRRPRFARPPTRCRSPAPQAAPEIAAGSSGNLFSNMGLAGAAGGAVGSSASLGRGDQRTRMTPRENPKPPQRPPNEAVTEIATELRELATRAQSLIAKLADSGLMTAEEVTEQKRRFLG